MKVWALVVDTWREALARYTLLGFFIVSSLFLLVLSFALNLDIVNGSLAAGSLFGKSFDMHHGQVPIDKVVITGQSIFTGMLYGMGVFLAVFATGSQVPHLLRRGTADLYMARPVSRTTVLLGRFVGAVTLVSANLLFLCGGVYLIISYKTRVWNPRFLLAGFLILAVFLCYLGFMYLIGVLSGSTPLSIMLPYAIFFIAMPLAAHKEIAAAMDSRWAARIVETLYWMLPKSAELGRDMVKLVMGEGRPDPWALGTTGVFGAACLAAAVVLFNRKNL
jgi:ABC-2 type transport system permease protein